MAENLPFELMNGLRKISNNFYSPTMAEKIGLAEAILINTLVYEEEYWAEKARVDEYGYFYSTIPNIQRKTGLSGKQQRRALDNLQELGLIWQRNGGEEKKRHHVRRFKLNEEKIKELIDKCIKGDTERFSKKAEKAENEPSAAEMKSSQREHLGVPNGNTMCAQREHLGVPNGNTNTFLSNTSLNTVNLDRERLEAETPVENFEKADETRNAEAENDGNRFENIRTAILQQLEVRSPAPSEPAIDDDLPF